MLRNLLILLLLAACLATLYGCSALNDKIHDNGDVVDAAVRQAVFKYIDAGDTEAEKNKRAGAVMRAVQNVDKFLEGEPTASPEALIDAIESQIHWEKLTPTDTGIMVDVLMLIRHNLQNRQSEGQIDGDAIITLRSVLKTALTEAVAL